MMQRPVFFSSQPTPFLVLFQENKKSCAETKFQHSPFLLCLLCFVFLLRTLRSLWFSCLFCVPERLYALRSGSAIRAGYAIALIGVIRVGRHLLLRRRRRRHMSRLTFRFNLFKQICQCAQIIRSRCSVFNFLQK